MELGNLFGKNQTTPLETFLAIQIQEDLVKTAIWQIEDGLPQILEFGPMLPWSDEDSLLVAVDNSLADALKDSSLDPDRVIFGLPENWIKQDKIAPEYSSHLKTILGKLKLKAVGFVVITEAILQHLKTQEGIPPTAIILELSLSKVNVVVVRLGKILGREEVARSDDLAKDVAEGLTRMELDQLPARFIIINGSDHEAEQQLSSYSWQEELSFLHLPKVEIPDPHFSIEAIALSGGSEAARSLGIDVTVPEDQVEEAVLQAEELSPADEQVETSTTKDAEDFGFNIEQEDQGEPFLVEGQTTDLPVALETPDTPEKKPSFINNISNFRPKITLPAFNFKTPAPNFANLKLPLLVAGIALLLLLPVSVFAFYNFMGKGSIQILVTPQELQKAFSVALSDSDHPSLPTLRAATETLEIEKTESSPTTGEAIVGDKATGEVTLYNKTDSAKALTKGTVIATTSNLKFILSEDVTIASRSSQVDENLVQTITPGKGTAPATASAIGPDSNIASGTTLSVASYPASSVEAKASKAFSGGTARTVQAVSKKDQEELLEKLTQALKQEAASQINGGAATSQVIALDDLEISTKEFDKNVGEEASNISLRLKANVSLLRYEQTQLQELILKQVSEIVPAGFTFEPSFGQVNISTPQVDSDGFVVADATVKASLLPSVNTADYLNRIKGKSIASANRLLETIPGFQKVKYLISPPIPILSTRLPINTSKLSLTIEPTTP